MFGAAIGVSFFALADFEALDLDVVGVFSKSTLVMSAVDDLLGFCLFGAGSAAFLSLAGEDWDFCSSSGCFLFSFEFATAGAADCFDGVPEVGAAASAISSSESLSDSLSELEDSAIRTAGFTGFCALPKVDVG